MVKLVVVPLFVRDTLPFTAPLLVGSKAIVNDALCPAVSVSGVERPDTLIPAPSVLAELMYTLSPPLFVTVTDWVDV
jgi:hypothetical protein